MHAWKAERISSATFCRRSRRKRNAPLTEAGRLAAGPGSSPPSWPAVERDRLMPSKCQAPGLSPEDRERAHRMTLKRYVAEPATWPPGMGPRPGETGCIVSADLLAEFNIHAAQAA